jgi:hypothetical protein
MRIAATGTRVRALPACLQPQAHNDAFVSVEDFFDSGNRACLDAAIVRGVETMIPLRKNSARANPATCATPATKLSIG